MYSLLAKARRLLYEKGILKKKKLPRPVISVGNLSVGGTGKTPFTIHISKLLQQKGYKVCVLSRGYKRKSKGTVVVCDGKEIFVSWQEAGDEPFLIASYKIPIVVSSSRYEAGIKALESFDVDIFILDDGFQHFQLYRDFDILLTQAQKPFWKDRPIPLGRLREPVETYKYADVIVLTKYKDDENLLKEAKALGKPVFTAVEKLEGLTNLQQDFSFDVLRGKKVFVFSALANNEQFFEKVKQLSKEVGFTITGFKGFKDHYHYKTLDLPDADAYLTTEKDLVKIKDKKGVYALKYKLIPSEEFDKLIVKTAEKLINSYEGKKDV